MNLNQVPYLFPIFWEEPQNEPTVVVVTPPNPEPEAEPISTPPAEQQTLSNTEIFQLGQRVGILEMENSNLRAEVNRLETELTQAKHQPAEPDGPANPEPLTQPNPTPEPERKRNRNWWA